MAEDIRDIKGPLNLPWEPGWLLWALLFVVIAAGAALLIYFLLRRRQKQIVPEGKPLLPNEEALLELDRLRDEHLPEAGKIKEYFFRLSAIVRWYLERRFGVPASEQTTEEFLSNMYQKDFLSENQKKTMKAFMEQSDLVKYAKYQASLAECRKGDEVARQLVEETRETVIASAEGAKQSP